MGTEAVFGIVVKIVGGGAPQEAVITALRRAGVVLFTLEEERELAELPVCVAELHLHHCQEIRIRISQRNGNGVATSGGRWSARSW